MLLKDNGFKIKPIASLENFAIDDIIISWDIQDK